MKCVVINTHHRLSACNLLAIGASFSLGIFQRVVDVLLQGIPQVSIQLRNANSGGRKSVVLNSTLTVKDLVHWKMECMQSRRTEFSAMFLNCEVMWDN